MVAALEAMQAVLPPMRAQHRGAEGVLRANWYEPGLNPTYSDLAAHYGTAILPARVERVRHALHAHRVEVRVQEQRPASARAGYSTEDAWPIRCGVMDLGLDPAFVQPAFHEARDLRLPGSARNKSRINGIDPDQGGKQVGNGHQGNLRVTPSGTVGPTLYVGRQSEHVLTPLELGEIRQKSGKRVTAWAVAGDLDTETVTSNTFVMEWPPRSGQMRSFPEVDRAGWVGVQEAREKLGPAQVELLDRLLAALGSADGGS